MFPILTIIAAVGCTVLTAAFHIPCNNALERRGAPWHWERYSREWVPGNHVRAIACTGAALSFTPAATRL